MAGRETERSIVLGCFCHIHTITDKVYTCHKIKMKNVNFPPNLIPALQILMFVVYSPRTHGMHILKLKNATIL